MKNNEYDDGSPSREWEEDVAERLTVIGLIDSLDHLNDLLSVCCGALIEGTKPETVAGVLLTYVMPAVESCKQGIRKL